MKNWIALVALTLPLMAQAKVADFNAMINENTKEQKRLHEEVKSGVKSTRVALHDDVDGSVVVVDPQKDTVNVPTNKKFMRFKKEIVNNQARSKDAEKRLANEFKSIDSEF